ncbi:uracil-DNA glycosylase [Shewanella intestini]|uniref:Uracil-DNA glycosylase n=1 Tax=Shewanella intestini TaxID=2017544 RepID=A0ABS5HXQ0_9GAMM|nr:MULTISPECIES: uracil-DNA glycosylase [Shewanella]MBR9726396.1 uracil-DNA glycosylase [Shewanella intestini]MRG35038.1 uracil-DNA glycosylase [Shewanella sp. XMDDZSB0408]
MQSWDELIKQQQSEAYFEQLQQAIDLRREQGVTIFPAKESVFNAFGLTPLKAVKVVILGQDPYHGVGQAHGLSFSVLKGVKTPPSLVNIYKELTQDPDVNFVMPQHGELTSWANQGVLLLNTVLTVEQGNAHSHAKLGWETFTDNVLNTLNQQTRPIVFILWGAHAMKKGKHIDKRRHCVLCGPHPSPLSAYRGFFGCGHFSKANAFLKQQQMTEINWQLPLEQ